MINRKTYPFHCVSPMFWLNPFFITILLLSAILFLPVISIAQDLTPEKIRIYTTADGLPSNRIYCMDQDKDGNLWIGTEKGASRFDGKTFTNYGAKDGFSDKTVWAILCDSKGNVWFVSDDGLFLFDGKRWENYKISKEGNPLQGILMKEEDDTSTEEIATLYEGENLKVSIISKEGKGIIPYSLVVYTLTKKEEKNENYNIINRVKDNITEDNQGNIGVGDGSIFPPYIFQYTKNVFHSYHNLYGTGAVEDSQGNIYISTDYGLKVYVKKENSFISIYHYTQDIDKKYGVYYTPRDKIDEWDGEIGGIPERVYHTPRDKIDPIDIDKSGKIWIGGNTHIAKSNDSGQTLSKFQYDQNKISSNNICWDMFIDNKQQIWTGNSDYVILYDGSEFHYYNKKNGLPDGSYNYIFQDRQDHLWFACGGGLAKFDNIPPKLVLIDTIPKIIKSPNLSFRFTGNDGQFGSSVKDLTYEYKFSNETKWQKAAENGQVSLDNFKINIDYSPRLQIRVTDSFNNSAETEIPLHVKIDKNAPKIIITNQEDFLKPLNKREFTFRFKGQDNFTLPDDLKYRYKLERNKEIFQNWSNEWKSMKEASFTVISSGDYSFVIQAKDKSGNIGKNKISFIVGAIVDKPQVIFSEINTCYFTEKNNRPNLKCDPVRPNQEIISGRIKFLVQSIDSRPGKQNLQYSYQLIHRDKKNEKKAYKFPDLNDLKDGKYTFQVIAKDQQGNTSLLEFPFTVKDFDKLPQTKIQPGESFIKGDFVGRIPDIRLQTELANCLFSYKLDNSDWSEFSSKTHFKFPALTTGQHTFQALAKNSEYIESMPDSLEFSYKNIPDMPLVWLSEDIDSKVISNNFITSIFEGKDDITQGDKTPEVISKNSITFTFEGKDDMTQGDKTPVEELRYSWRLIPVDPAWSRPSPEKQVSYTDLENRTYFFQVKVLDKSENECVVPAELSFEIRVIPFYRYPRFIWSVSIGGIFLAALLSVVFTRRHTRRNIYDQRYNPYIVGEAVHDPEMFFGRDILMRDIFQSLKSNSLCITGERRIGKTTMLEHLEKSAQKPLFSFFCNLEGVKEELFFSRIMQHLTNKIQAEFKEKEELTGLNLFLKDRETYDDVDFEDDIETVLNWLRTAYDPQVSIIMCLDEIDATQNFSNDIHAILRNVFQTYQGQIRMIAAGVSIHRGNWRLPTSPWYNFFEFVKVTPLDSESASELIIKPVKGFYKFEHPAIDFILAKTNHKPFYIQRICKQVIFKILDEECRIVTQKDVTEVYDDLIRLELNREFETFWEQLSPDLRCQIIAAASDETVQVSKEHEAELMNNQYNYGHRVIIIHDAKIEFSTIFKDWLFINYVRTKGQIE